MFFSDLKFKNQNLRLSFPAGMEFIRYIIRGGKRIWLTIAPLAAANKNNL
jgi:hypothetical protein